MIPERIERLLGGDALAALREHLRRRVERGASGIVRIPTPSVAQRLALCGLLGRRPSTGASLRVDLGELGEVLRNAGLADSLRHALEMLDGPIVDRTAKQLTQTKWQQLRRDASEPSWNLLLESADGLGLLKRLSRRDVDAAACLCGQAQQVLARLPARGIARAQLAAEVLSDAHGLDPGRAVGTLVLATLKLAAVREHGMYSQTAAELRRSERIRIVWAAAGVLVNELARPALHLNIPTMPMYAWAEPGEPGYISLRKLLSTPPRWNVGGRRVFVCENANLVGIAADTLGAACAPLVCTDGMPGAAQRTLLGQLKAAGAELCFHGDFDWAGIGIANVVVRLFDVVPWRFCSDDYVLGVARQATEGKPLGRDRRDACWDGRLSVAMAAHGRSVDEEAVAPLLVQDLACGDGTVLL